jgi:hypothetical protein
MFTELYLMHTTFRRLDLLSLYGRICIIKLVLLRPFDLADLHLQLFLQVSPLTFYMYLLFPQASIVCFI